MALRSCVAAQIRGRRAPELLGLARRLQPRIHRLALERQHSEDALVHAIQRLAVYEPMQRLEPERKLFERPAALAIDAARAQPLQVLGAVYSCRPHGRLLRRAPVRPMFGQGTSAHTSYVPADGGSHLAAAAGARTRAGLPDDPTIGTVGSRCTELSRCGRARDEPWRAATPA